MPPTKELFFFFYIFIKLDVSLCNDMCKYMIMSVKYQLLVKNITYFLSLHSMRWYLYEIHYICRVISKIVK